ncbi:MAG: hypothetical protein LBR52_04260 [Prevotellaceae bacterium]|jgi:uncharacterized membrane protein YeaQ/YmgE (transglycosylase-associated protein family)|nr:hypothetical protein [Prevotellaceae bacterium]
MNENNQEDSVKNNKNRPHDFLKGLGLGFLIPIAGIFLGIIAGAVSRAIAGDEDRGVTIATVVTILFYIGAIIASACKGRTRFALGLITFILIPVAVFGGCLVMLSNTSFR